MLLQSIRDQVVALTDEDTWDKMTYNMGPELLSTLLTGDNTKFIDFLNQNKDKYGLTQADVDLVETEPSNIVVPETGGTSTAQLVESLTLTAGTTTTSVTIEQFIKATAVVPNLGSEIIPTGVVDPTNVSTGEANLINDNLTDLVYNNSSSGTVNKELPGVDLGSNRPVGLIRLHHWTNAAYTSSNYKIQAAVNGANLTLTSSWVDLATGLDSTGLEGQFTDINVSGNYRYIRPFCVQGNNTSWWVVSELDVFSEGVGTTERLVSEVPTLSFQVNTSGFIEITNSGGTIPVKIYYL